MYKDKNIKNILFIITVSVICLSILLLIVLHNRTNTIFQSIVVWLILYIISHWCLKSLPLAIFTSVILVLLLTFVRCNNNVTENFEDEDKKDEDKKDEDKKDEDEILKGRTNVVRNIENKKGDMSDDLGLSEISKMLEGLEDEKEDNKGLKSTSDGNDKLGASGAQRETFRLINTVNELDKTLKALSPTLNQGKNIIEMMKKLNL